MNKTYFINGIGKTVASAVLAEALHADRLRPILETLL
jgi:dethiobiotin synthetase